MSYIVQFSDAAEVNFNDSKPNKCQGHRSDTFFGFQLVASYKEQGASDTRRNRMTQVSVRDRHLKCQL